MTTDEKILWLVQHGFTLPISVSEYAGMITAVEVYDLCAAHFARECEAIEEGPEWLPCPHCGSSASLHTCDEIENPHYGGAFIQCDDKGCAATTQVVFGEYKDALKGRWNRRTDSAAAIDALYRAMKENR